MGTVAERAEPAAAGSTETMADLLRRLGDISPERVRMHPAPGTATEKDVVAIEAHEDRLFELVEGVLVEKGMGFYESLLGIRIAVALAAWVDARNAGVVTGSDGMLRLFPGLVRIPDVAFASWERLGGRIPKEAIPQLAPELVVEVLSKSNTKREMKRKRGEYFKVGVRVVWEVDGKTRCVAVYEAPEQVEILRQEQTLEGGDVLPGFSLSLAKLFAEPGK
jgi:Uma2 family endonuclease